jgi:Domain of unknown function (DUF4259)
MGAWSDKPFDNDSALDWLSAADDVGALESAFETALSASYLDVDDGSSAVAAAAVVAAAFDGNVSELPADARALAGDVKVDAKLRAHAVEALDRVLGPASELASLWGEGGNDSDFRRGIEQLRARLQR